MSADEQAIRDLVAHWHRATAAGDVDIVLGLMADDVVFLVPGQPPIRGRSAFLHKQASGSWVLTRDANLLTPAS